jgi:hypothetical protein
MHEMKVMAHEDESLTGEFQVKILVLKRRYVKVIMDLIRELQDQEGGKKVDLRVATFSLFGMMNWIYTWYQPNEICRCASYGADAAHLLFRCAARSGS